MNRRELIKIVQEKTDLPLLTIDCVLCETLNAIRDAVFTNEEVRLTRFGTFGSKKRPARSGRNLKTGERITIPAKTVPTFKPSKEFLSKKRNPV